MVRRFLHSVGWLLVTQSVQISAWLYIYRVQILVTNLAVKQYLHILYFITYLILLLLDGSLNIYILINFPRWKLSPCTQWLPYVFENTRKLIFYSLHPLPCCDWRVVPFTCYDRVFCIFQLGSEGVFRSCPRPIAWRGCCPGCPGHLRVMAR